MSWGPHRTDRSWGPLHPQARVAGGEAERWMPGNFAFASVHLTGCKCIALPCSSFLAARLTALNALAVDQAIAPAGKE